jgi:hypothetical protein
MKIVIAQPPNFEQVAAVFPEARNKDAVFTYGDTVYNPSGAVLSVPLQAHEAVHVARQTDVVR